MLQTKLIDDIAKEVGKLIPAGMGQMQRDVEKNLRAAVERSFDRMGLVTREDYDVQCAVLARTREKLEGLERRVAELETALLAKR